MVSQLSPRELADAIAAGKPVYLIDVRKPWEHERAALPGSLLVPLDELTERVDEIEPPPGALVVAYCHHGVRSLSAAALLDRLGLPGVASLRGGIDAWSREIDPSIPRY
ncbi:rhodanese-like domain-containing protein [Polyangium sp. 6x1]|uniref:rhodanese-like domain-containing protein n=1 Tax=Polyangium sp. 6x1 TaxID=3042689 RepID=UPI00248270CB|nr:rhodanese-like domain-containing protein [Polyangium sp. 6x1]MDI1451273.1 rhodanese-like domain-containing protein [Polyangium sp. 6x1]